MRIRVAMMVMILLPLGVTARAQSSNTDPVASAMARIQEAVDTRLSSIVQTLEAARHRSSHGSSVIDARCGPVFARYISAIPGKVMELMANDFNTHQTGRR